MLDNCISRRKIATAIAIGAAVVVLTMAGLVAGCSSDGEKPAQSDASDQTQQSTRTQATTGGDSGKVLVAYYSAQGHTAEVAKAVADELGADLFEIMPEQEHSEEDLDWTDSNSRVSREHDDESLRDVALSKTTPDNWASYDTVLVGYPIWWVISAWPTNRFAADNDFTGKTVIPFCTSSSSDMGQSGQILADAAGTGDWKEGHRFSSGATDDEVRTWAREI